MIITEFKQKLHKVIGYMFINVLAHFIITCYADIVDFKKGIRMHSNLN